MARFAPFLLFFSGFVFLAAVIGQELEIGPEILLAGSPAAMLFAFLESQEDLSGVSQALNYLPSACKTEGLEKDIQTTDVETKVDCNLTGIDPECFLINIAGMRAFSGVVVAGFPQRQGLLLGTFRVHLSCRGSSRALRHCSERGRIPYHILLLPGVTYNRSVVCLCLFCRSSGEVLEHTGGRRAEGSRDDREAA